MGALGGILVVLLLCSGERANKHSFELIRKQHVFPITEVVKNNLLESAKKSVSTLKQQLHDLAGA
jgi:hypothetical protein